MYIALRLKRPILDVGNTYPPYLAKLSATLLGPSFLSFLFFYPARFDYLGVPRHVVRLAPLPANEHVYLTYIVMFLLSDIVRLLE